MCRTYYHIATQLSASIIPLWLVPLLDSDSSDRTSARPYSELAMRWFGLHRAPPPALITKTCTKLSMPMSGRNPELVPHQDGSGHRWRNPGTAVAIGMRPRKPRCLDGAYAPFDGSGLWRLQVPGATAIKAAVITKIVHGAYCTAHL